MPNMIACSAGQKFKNDSRRWCMKGCTALSSSFQPEGIHWSHALDMVGHRPVIQTYERVFAGSGLCVWCLGFGVWGLEFGVWGLGFGVWNLGFGVWGLGLDLSPIVHSTRLVFDLPHSHTQSLVLSSPIPSPPTVHSRTVRAPSPSALTAHPATHRISQASSIQGRPATDMV